MMVRYRGLHVLTDRGQPHPDACAQRIGGFPERNSPQNSFHVCPLVHIAHDRTSLVLKGEQGIYDGRAYQQDNRSRQPAGQQSAAALEFRLTTRCWHRTSPWTPPGPTSCSTVPATMSRSCTSPAGRRSRHFSFPMRTAATSRPSWSAAKAQWAASSARDFLPAYTRICVKFGGPFARIHVAKLDAAKMRSASLRNIFARYADCMLAQMFQSTACNAIHSIEQRTAKWIIAAMERTARREQRAADA